MSDPATLTVPRLTDWMAARLDHLAQVDPQAKVVGVDCGLPVIRRGTGCLQVLHWTGVLHTTRRI